MTTSAIRDIYTTMAGKVVTVRGTTPAAYDLDALPNSVESSMLPCRLLTPMNPKGEARDFSFIALGKLSKLTWHITDLMLWREAATGIGLEDIAPVLIDYAVAYIEMLRQNRAMGQAQAHIVNARFVYGTFEWPEQSGRIYDGVSCEIDIEEALSGA